MHIHRLLKGRHQNLQSFIFHMRTKVSTLLLVILVSILFIGCSHRPSEIKPITTNEKFVMPSDRLLVNDWMKYREMDASFLMDSSKCTGDQKTLFLVTLSGGGSRAAYFAARVLHELDAIEGTRLTPYIDGIFSVSGGSLTAALYGISDDEVLEGKVNSHRPQWSEKLTQDILSKRLAKSMVLELLSPVNLGSYLFGDLSRTDLLQKAIEENVFQNSEDIALTYESLNPKRPPIFIISAIATSEGLNRFAAPFGSLFIFSRPDFIKLGNDLSTVSLAKAVTASAAFPGLLSPVTIPRYRLSVHETQLGIPRYIHLIDGGNADNLGLLGVKRALLENKYRLLRECNNIVVLSVDAFGRQGVNVDERPREKSSVGWFFDHKSALASFDALLAANRARLLGEFKSRTFMPPGNEELCKKDGLPDDICGGGVRADWNEINRLVKQKLYFVHLNFASPEMASQTNVLFCKGLDSSGKPICPVEPVDGVKLSCEKDHLIQDIISIPTTFGLSPDEVKNIQTFVSMQNHPHNMCLKHLHDVVTNRVQHSSDFYKKASASCDETPILQRDETPIVRCNIRGNIFGDLEVKDPAKRISTFREDCQKQRQLTVEERMAYLLDAKKKLMAFPEFLEGKCGIE